MANESSEPAVPASPIEGSGASEQSRKNRILYLSQGKLFIRDGSQSDLIESQYGNDVIKRALERQIKNEWKTGGDSVSALYNRQSLWGVGADNPSAMNVRITAVAPGVNPDEINYVVSTDSVGGVFSYNLKTRKETRLFHREQLALTDFSRHEASDMVACCRRFPNGTASIAVWRGNDVTEITEGDSLDEAPRWIPGGGKELVYQCCGVGRNKNGFMVEIGPASIQRLNVETGALTTLAEDASFDFMSPQMDRDGNLYFIRRPYESISKRSYPAHKVLLDALLLPYRLLKAFFNFLNFLSMTFSKEPLTTASGPKVNGLDERMLFLRGRLIDTEEALKRAKDGSEPPGLVPKNWQLIRRSSGGEESVLADSVLAYDLDPEGNLIYSTGTAVYRIDTKGGVKELIFKDNVIDTLLCLR